MALYRLSLLICIYLLLVLKNVLLVIIWNNFWEKKNVIFHNFNLFFQRPVLTVHCRWAYCKSIIVSVNNARICHLLQFACKETDKAIIDRSVGSLDIYLLEDKPGQSVLLDPFLTFSLKCQLQTFLWCQEGKC